MITIKKHLFLVDPSGGGKTTLLRETLGESLEYAGGFVTERVCAEDGSLLGFELYPAAKAAGVEGFAPLRFLDYSVSPPKADKEVFREAAARMLDEAACYPFSMIDEFGGFELLVPQFRKALESFLSSEQPVIGVLKDIDSAEELRRRFGLGEKYILLVRRLRQALEADPDTILLRSSGRDDAAARNIVRQWAAEYARAQY